MTQIVVARDVLVETEGEGFTRLGAAISKRRKMESETNRMRGLNRANRDANVGLARIVRTVERLLGALRYISLGRNRAFLG